VECYARECMLVHARAAVTVDLPTVKAFLLEKLRRVVAGESVTDLAEKWPTPV
jgi:hypothetical protein